MNKQAFFGKNVAQNTASSADLLADGAAGIFGINAATFQAEKVAGGSTYDRFWIAMGRAAGAGSRVGRAIDVLPSNQDFDYKKMPYSPAVTETKLVSIDCSGSKGVYDVFALRVNIRFADDIEADNDVYSATYHATGKFLTARAVYDAWATEVNNAGVINSKLVVVSTDAGLQVSPSDARQVVEIGVEYYNNPAHEACATCTDCNASVETLNEYDAGSGTLAQVLELVRESAPYSGTQYNLDRNISSPLASDLANAASLYAAGADILYIKWKNKDQPKGDVSRAAFNVYQEIFLIYPTGTDTGAIESVLNTLFNTTIKTSLAS